MKCDNGCTAPAEAKFTWLASVAGVQQVCLCKACASSFWSTYNNTPIGQSLRIENVTEDV